MNADILEVVAGLCWLLAAIVLLLGWRELGRPRMARRLSAAEAADQRADRIAAFHRGRVRAPDRVAMTRHLGPDALHRLPAVTLFAKHSRMRWDHKFPFANFRKHMDETQLLR